MLVMNHMNFYGKMTCDEKNCYSVRTPGVLCGAAAFHPLNSCDCAEIVSLCEAKHHVFFKTDNYTVSVVLLNPNEHSSDCSTASKNIFYILHNLIHSLILLK